jgi:hypothetical protein
MAPLLKVNKQAFFNFYFLAEPSDPTLWTCRKCENPYKRGAGAGWTNLYKHLEVCHGGKDLTKMFQDSVSGGRIDLHLNRMAGKKELDAFHWIEWLVMRNMPLAEVDNQLTKKCFRYEGLSSKTVRKYILALREDVEETIKQRLPKKYAILFDGWSHETEHFLGMTAAYGGSNSNNYVEILLSLQPLLKDGITGLTAEDHMVHITKALCERYGRSLDEVVCLVGDNCSVNQSLARKLDIPLLGCGAHKLNLAIRAWILEQPGFLEAIEKVSKLMSKARTTKNSAKLRALTNLKAIKDNETRWTSTFRMVERFLRLKDEFTKVDTLDSYIPSASEVRTLETNFEFLKKFNLLIKDIQRTGMSFIEVRLLFDFILADHPTLGPHLRHDASIVQDVPFETALMKLHSGTPLTVEEQETVARLRIPTVAGDDEQGQQQDDETRELSYLEKVQIQLKRRRLNEFSTEQHQYMNLEHLPGTSVTLERLFSSAKFVLTDARNRTSPVLFEALIFLQKNRQFWDVNSVGRAMGMQVRPDWVDQDSDVFYDD